MYKCRKKAIYWRWEWLAMRNGSMSKTMCLLTEMENGIWEDSTPMVPFWPPGVFTMGQLGFMVVGLGNKEASWGVEEAVVTCNSLGPLAFSLVILGNLSPSFQRSGISRKLIFKTYNRFSFNLLEIIAIASTAKVAKNEHLQLPKIS